MQAEGPSSRISIPIRFAYNAALKGEPWAVCFWLKCQGGWKEKQQVEHSGPEGGGGITLVVRSVLQPAEVEN